MWVCLIIVPFIALYVASGHSLDILNYGTSGFYFPFISGKNIVFRFLIEIAFFSWVVLALKDASYRINIRKSPLLVAYGIFMLILLAADIFGVDPFKSFWSNFERMEGFVGHIHLFAYFVVLTGMLRTSIEYGRMFKALIASNIVVLVFGYGQLLGANGYIFSKLLPTVAAKFSAMFPIHMSENRLDATLGNSAYFAIYCLIFIFILALRWSEVKDGKNIWLYPTLIVLNLIALFYTGTRGTQIGLVVGTLLTLGLMVFRWNDSKWQATAIGASTILYSFYLTAALFFNNDLLSYFAHISYAYVAILLVAAIATCVVTKDRFRKIGAGIFVAILAIILLFQAVKENPFVKNSPTLARLASISPSDITTASRLSIWKISFVAFKERPILGYGQDNFGYIYASKFIPDKMWNLESWYDRSHDVFFDWLVAAGALGLISYLSLYVIALWLMWGKKSDMPFKERAIITGALAGYFVHNIFVFDNLISYILFFFLLAYIAFRTGSRGEVHGGKVISDDQMNMLYLPVVAILLVGTLYMAVYRPIMVNKLLVKGLDINRLMQTMSFADAVKVEQEAFEKAIAMHTVGSEEAREQYLQTAVRIAQVTIPEDVPAADKQRSIDAINSMVAGARKDVENSYEAHKSDVRMLSIYGMFFNGINDGVSAEKVLTQAHSLAPKKQLVSFDLVRAYLIQGKSAEGYALAKETYDSATAYPDAAKMLLLSSAYAFKWNESRAYITSHGQTVPFDADILNALVTTKQIPLAIQLLNELKANKPEYAAQVDAYIKELLAGGKK